MCFILCAFCFASFSQTNNLSSFVQIPSLVHEVFERYLTSSCVSNNIYQSFCQLLSKEDTSIVYLEYINLSHHCSRVGGRQVFQHILYMCTLEICPSTLPQIRVQVQRLHQNSSPSPNSWEKVKSVLKYLLSEKFKSVLKYLLKHTPSPPSPNWGGGLRLTSGYSMQLISHTPN